MRRLLMALATVLCSACAAYLPLPEFIPAPPAEASTEQQAADAQGELHVPRYPPARPSDKIIRRACTLRFDDREALAKLPDDAQDTVAYWSQYGRTACESVDGSGCWIYKQNCGPIGDIRYEEYPFRRDGFIHLQFERLNCQDEVTGAYGRRTAAGCNRSNIDYRAEDRYARGSKHDQVHRLWVQDEGIPALFSLDTLRILGRPHDRVEVRVKLLNDSWLAWPSLAPGRYDMGIWAANIVEMRVRGAQGTSSVVQLDDLRIKRAFVVE